MRVGRIFALIVVMALSREPRAEALDEVHAGMAVWPIWAFLPLQIGLEEGLWQKYGIDLDITNNGSGAKLMQAMTAGSIDFGLSSGVEMAFGAKGAPVRAIAAYAGEPRTVTVIVAADSPITKPAQLKGKLIALPGVGSVSEWLVWQMAITEGWGKSGIQTVAAGSIEGCLAAIKSHQTDAMVGPPELGYLLESRHEGRVAFSLAPFAPHFLAHVVYARSELIQDNPDLVERFLKGFFAGVIFMKTHKEETTRVAVRELHSTPEIMNRLYDALAPWLERDGRFDPQAIETLKASYVDLGIVDKKPSTDQLLTQRFVPVKP